MSTKKVASTAISERLLRLISEKAKGKPSAFAKKAGIPHGTLYGYIEGRMPASEHLIRIRDTFGVNLNWLLTGEGDPYLHEAERQVTEPDHPYNLPEEIIDSGIVESGEKLGGRDRLGELLGLAVRVLASGNQQAADALEKNIRYFAHAIEQERRLARVEDRLAALEDILRKKKGGNGQPSDPDRPFGRKEAI